MNQCTHFARLPVCSIATADPFFAPDIKPAGTSVSIPLIAARSADALMNGCKKGCL
jgi:hypothetical protein